MNLDRIAFLSASTAAIGLVGAALAAEPPVLKAGLWEVTRASTQQPNEKHLTTMCLDDTVQAEMREFGMGVAKEMCSQSDRHLEGNRMTITATCKLGPTTMKTQSVMVFNGNTSYHTEGTATYDPPFMNMAESKSTIDGKWTGPCKPGQQPGDITTETGQTLNMKQMMKK
jgi:Protein of unknown function (DUF3617)